MTSGSPRRSNLRRGEGKTGKFRASGSLRRRTKLPSPRRSEIELVHKSGLFALFHRKFLTKTKQPQSTSNSNSNQLKTLLLGFFLHKPKQGGICDSFHTRIPY